MTMARWCATTINRGGPGKRSSRVQLPEALGTVDCRRPAESRQYHGRSRDRRRAGGRRCRAWSGQPAGRSGHAGRYRSAARRRRTRSRRDRRRGTHEPTGIGNQSGHPARDRAVRPESSGRAARLQHGCRNAHRVVSAPHRNVPTERATRPKEPDRKPKTPSSWDWCF